MNERHIGGIDLRNPGHFFACCGILYCVDRMVGYAESYFRDDKFYLCTDFDGDPLIKITTELRALEITHKTEDADSPISIDNIPIWLDFWNHFDNRPKLKLFAGQERSTKLLSKWQDYFKPEINLVNITDIESSEGKPSGFDTSTSWNTLDEGFSLNEQGMDKRRAYPLVEFFSYLGVQSYCWEITESKKYRYTAWSVPLPAAVSMAVAAGALHLPPARRFEFETRPSGQKKVLKRAKEISMY